MSDFDALGIEDMVAVGATDSREVRLWVRTTRPGVHEVEVWGDGGAGHGGTIELDPAPGADGTTSFVYPDEVAGAGPLEPCTRYRFRITREGKTLGEGAFETAPEGRADTPERFSFAVLSCHQPFDDDGNIDPRGLKMLSILDQVFRDHAVKRVFLVGDQMYTDYPKDHSLFDDDFFATVAPPGRKNILECTRAEVRDLLHRRFRAFWAIEPFRKLLASWPCYMILDDHEVVDNFGSAPEHSSKEWRALREGALDACFDYEAQLLTRHQLGRQRPDSFHYQLTYGNVGLFCLDLRSQRVNDGDELRAFGDEQVDALEHFLTSNGDKDVMMVVVSVPLMVFPDWLASAGVAITGEGSDAADRWSYPMIERSRRRLAQILCENQRRNPHQRTVLLGGDIHVGAVTRFNWKDPEIRDIYQLASSAVSNLEMALARKLGSLVPNLRAELEGEEQDVWARVELMKGISGADSNPFDKLNVGIVEMCRNGDGTTRVKLKLVGHDDGDPPRPKVVFETEPL